MRPRIDKRKWWDKITPTEQKELDRVAKKWVVVKYLYRWNDPAHFEPREVWRVEALEDDQNLRYGVERHPNASIVMERLNERDAHMWAKMMS